MYKIILLCTIIAVASATPGLLGVAVHHPVAQSQQTRHDIINPGAITVQSVHSAPVLQTAQVVHAAPVVRTSSAHTSQIDIRQGTAAVAALPVAAATVGVVGGHGRLGNGLGLGGGAAGELGGGLGLGGLGGLGGNGHGLRL